jgi:hypothetical protein
MNIFFYIHMLVLIVGILMPFFANTKQLEFYSILIPFLFFHWAVNDDTCILTNLEQMATGEEKERTFMGRLIGPIYNLSDDDIGKAIKLVLFTLWFYVQFKLGHLRSIFQR